MLTPVFHPNFDDSTVCIGDFWAASEGLGDLIVRIGRMIAYQEYNTKSPLNGLAAKWSEQHAHLFPVDGRDIAPPLDKPQPPALPVASPDAPSGIRRDSPGRETAPAAPDPSSNGVTANRPASDPWAERISIE